MSRKTWSATLPAAVHLDHLALAVHFSTALPDWDWLVELRGVAGGTTAPHSGGTPGQRLDLPGGAVLTLGARFTGRLWHARLSTAVVPYLLRHGSPIRYSYVQRPWPIESYQTVFGTTPGSAEMPSASRPFPARRRPCQCLPARRSLDRDECRGGRRRAA